MIDARLRADTFITNEKIDRLSDAAHRVYVNGICWSVAQGTDGRIPSNALRMLRPKPVTKAIVAELVSGGLWDVSPGGWQVHDFLEYQTSNADMAQARKDSARRSAEYRERKAAELEAAKVEAERLRSLADNQESDASRHASRTEFVLGEDRTGSSEGAEVTTGTAQNPWAVGGAA